MAHAAAELEAVDAGPVMSMVPPPPQCRRHCERLMNPFKAAFNGFAMSLIGKVNYRSSSVGCWL